jgi:proline iminopeptidase
MRRAWILGMVVALAAGALLGSVMPRGPVTTAQALTAMLVGLLTGAVVGFACRSRWGMLAGPLAFVVAFELARIGTVGPVVDRPEASVLGVVALVVGRGFDGLVILVPMLLGAALGAAGARRRSPGLTGPAGGPRPGRWLVVRRGATTLTAVAILAFAVLIAAPARTAPLVGSDGEPVAGSVAELATVSLGGHEQVLMIRGARRDAPVLLWLAGGPGGSDIGAMRLSGSRLEDSFVVVTWEQRGTGKSYRSLDPAGTLTAEQAVADTLELTDLLRTRFGQERIYIAGNSWGTMPAVLAVARHPERFHAYVGAGQMVSLRATDEIFYADTLAYARQHGDTGLERTLLELGPPPYARFLDYGPGVFGGEPLWNDYQRLPGSQARSEMPGTLLVDEYTLVEKIRTAAATLDTLGVLYPRVQELDLRTDAPRLEVPVFLVQGRHEARGRAELAAAWFDQLQAPSKELIVFEDSGHRPMFEEGDRFAEVMVERVLAATWPD